MSIEQKRNKLIEDLIYNNGQLNGQICQRNIKIAERIKELAIVRRNTQDPMISLIIKSEIDWLTELADI